ncbi:MAG: TauD/TfdA family dioxygenase [Blastocatellia bacterium]
MQKENPHFKSFTSIKRERLKLSAETLVRTGYLDAERRLPLVIEPNVDHLNLINWASNNRQFVEEELSKHAAILFRNFNLKLAAEFEEFIEVTSGGALEYNERSSPRTQVRGNIYTSTEHPPDQRIFLHNEQSYNITFPRKIFFMCVTPALQGGETPVADCRKVFDNIAADIRERFLEKGYVYVRNFGAGPGLTWQIAFQTHDKTTVERYCHKNDIGFEWKDGNRLKTRQKRRAAARHPRTGEMVWFNHLTFFHVSTLERPVRDVMMAEFDEDDLPNNTYYGDGTKIEPEVLDKLRGAYIKEEVAFGWQQGDILMLDNMLAAHGRRSYTGPRKVIAGMAEPFSWKTL